MVGVYKQNISHVKNVVFLEIKCVLGRNINIGTAKHTSLPFFFKADRLKKNRNDNSYLGKSAFCEHILQYNTIK